VIIVAFFYHGECDHKQQWCDKRDKEADPKRLNYLRECDKQKKQIEEVLELIEEHYRHKTVPRILRVDDRVVIEQESVFARTQEEYLSKLCKEC